MLTNDEARALAVLSALVALGAVLGWVDARHPQYLRLTLGDSLALGALEAPPDSSPQPTVVAASPLVSQNAPADTGSGATAASAPPAGAYDLEGRLDVNRATAEELESLPGIGPKTAARIVEDRAKRGRFRSARDLGRVKGIGPKTLERLLPKVTAGPAPRPAGR